MLIDFLALRFVNLQRVHPWQMIENGIYREPHRRSGRLALLPVQHELFLLQGCGVCASNASCRYGCRESWLTAFAVTAVLAAK